MNATIRKATAADAHAIRALAKQFQEYLRTLGDRTQFEFTAETYLRNGFGPNPAFAGLVAEIDGEVRGLRRQAEMPVCQCPAFWFSSRTVATLYHTGTQLHKSSPLCYCPTAEPMSPQPTDIRELIRACTAGDAEARRRFQDEHGEDIYNFPVKIYGLSVEEAGDFYVYVFDNDRLFTRLRTFEGRNSIQFRTFLSYYVLKYLFLEWRRTSKEIETVSLHTPLGDSTEGARVLEDILPDSTAPETKEGGSIEEGPAAEIWSALSSEERLDLKLLSLLECDLGPEDIRLLAKISGRSIGETLALLAEVQDGLKRKDEKLSRLRDALDSVWGWILLRQKELQEIDEKIRLMTVKGDASGQEELLTYKKELERTLTKRHRQKEKLVEELRTYKLTTPYKDIARLLHLTVGTVCSRIFRLRERLVREVESGRL